MRSSIPVDSPCTLKESGPQQYRQRANAFSGPTAYTEVIHNPPKPSNFPNPVANPLSHSSSFHPSNSPTTCRQSETPDPSNETPAFAYIKPEQHNHQDHEQEYQQEKAPLPIYPAARQVTHPITYPTLPRTDLNQDSAQAAATVTDLANAAAQAGNIDLLVAMIMAILNSGKILDRTEGEFATCVELCARMMGQKTAAEVRVRYLGEEGRGERGERGEAERRVRERDRRLPSASSVRQSPATGPNAMPVTPRNKRDFTPEDEEFVPGEYEWIQNMRELFGHVASGDCTRSGNGWVSCSEAGTGL